MSFPTQLRVSLVWMVAVFASILLVVLAINMYPVPDGDSVYFLPAIKSYAAAGIASNKLVNLSYLTDPKGLGRFLFYIPGFPVAVGALMALFGFSSYKSTLLFIAFFRVASVLIFAKVLIIAMARRGRQGSLFSVLLAAVLVLSNALFLLPSNGRPEILSIFLVSISLLAALSIQSRLVRHGVISLCIGLLFPISIANGIIACSLYLFYALADLHKPGARFAVLALSLLLGVGFTVLAYAAGGLPLLDGIQGLILHSKIQLGRSNAGMETYYLYWLGWVVFAIFSLAYLLIVFLSHSGPATKPHSLFDRLWLVSALIVLAFAVYFFGIRLAVLHYNLYAFLPLYQFFSFCLIVDFAAYRPRLLRFSLLLILSAGLFLSLIEPLRAIALFPYYLISGSTYSEARQNFARLKLGDCALMLSTGLAVLDDLQIGSEYKTDQSSRMVLSKRLQLQSSKNKCVVAVVQETNINSERSAPVNMEKLADYGDRSPWTARLKALRLLNSPKGYSFRVYRVDLPLPGQASN